MHVLLLVVLFNIYSGDSGKFKVEKVYPEGGWYQCGADLNNTGPQKPDKDGNVKLYECVQQGDRSEVHWVTEL